jgi:hypothetical protein
LVHGVVVAIERPRLIRAVRTNGIVAIRTCFPAEIVREFVHSDGSVRRGQPNQQAATDYEHRERHLAAMQPHGAGGKPALALVKVLVFGD